MMTPAERLRATRRAAGYRSARSAAQAMGVPVATYIQHENGNRAFTAEAQDRYLAFFGATPVLTLQKPVSGHPGGA